MASNNSFPTAPEAHLEPASAFGYSEEIVMEKNDDEDSRKRSHEATFGGDMHHPDAKRLHHQTPPGIDAGSEAIHHVEGSLEQQDDRKQAAVPTVAEDGSKRKSWDLRFEELKQYRMVHGDCLVPQKYPPNPKLGRWVENQRSQYNRYMKAIESGTSDPFSSGMGPERIAMLEEVDFVWRVGRGAKGKGKKRRSIETKEKSSETWNQRFQELKAYKEQHGDCNVPNKYAANPQLGMWVTTQRSQYRAYMKSKESGEADAFIGGMNEDRIALLESIGFAFTLAPGWDNDTWNARLEELKAFKAQHGHTDVPTKDSALGKWVGNQRTQYALYTKETDAGAVEPLVGGITAERISKLEELGFNWRVGRGRGQPAAGLPFGESVALSESSQVQPDDPNFQALQNSEWDQRIQELKEYKAEHGHLLVPTKLPSNPKLGRFVSNQRAQYYGYMREKQSGKAEVTTRRLNDERIAELNNLGFVWSVKGKGREDQNARQRWNERYNELKAYKAEHGDCLVPTKYAANPKLARWVGNQRAHFRLYMKAKEEGTKDPMAGGMNDERVALLEEIGFAWTARPASETDSWNVRFQELVEYRDEHGDCLVPRNYPDNPKLANFVSNQRTHYRLYQNAQESGNPEGAEYTFMTAERIGKLNSIGFTWTLRKRRPKKEIAEDNAEMEEAREDQPYAAAQSNVAHWEV